MVTQGHVQNGVIVLDSGIRLPEGQKVTVVAPEIEPDMTPVPVSEEKKKAILGLIGIWKMENPPNDEEVEKILEEELMRKYG